jgi:hypothetical protein
LPAFLYKIFSFNIIKKIEQSLQKMKF